MSQAPRRRSSRLRLALRAAAVPAVAVLALGSPVHVEAQRAVDGYRYSFHIETGDDSPMRGVAYGAGDRTRIELLDDHGRRGRGYLLVTDGGRTLMAVDPAKREYSVATAEQFERIVGTAMEVADKVMTLELHDVDVTGRRLGSGGRIAGYDTQHSRLSATYGLHIGALGFTTRQQHQVDVDYWAAPGLALPRNPLVELFSTLPMVLAQSDRDFVTRMRVGREALVGQGTPLRVVVQSRETDDKGKEKRQRTTIQITEVARAAQEPSRFEVPAGYRKRDGFHFNVKH